MRTEGHTGEGTERVKTTCTRDCPDACGMVATVEQGRVTRLQGDREHPVTQGFLCYRTSRFLERQYHPKRITTPLLRRHGTFQPISWDEALDHVAERLMTFRDQSGGASILNYRSGGSMGLMKHLTDYFFEQFGPVTIKSGDVCSGAGDAAQLTDFGEEDSNDLFDLLNSRTIVLWGKNPYIGSIHLLPILRKAKQQGARLVQVDPVYHRGSSLCDFYLQPRPGGDVALALGVARWLFQHQRTDPQAPSYCDHFELYRALVMSRPLDGWAAEADVALGDLERLAEAYAAGPSAILVGWGMQRRQNGSTAVRLLDALTAVSGNIGISGGGVSFYFKRRGAFDLSFIRGAAAAPRLISEPKLGPAILEAKDPPVRMVWVSCGNPVVMLPESVTVAQALQSREFSVVVDSFLTDTARCAHLVLPAATMLEDEDVVGAYGNHFVGNVRPVVPPPPGVKTDYQILQALAPRVGLGDLFLEDAREWKTRLLAHSGGINLDALEGGAQRNPQSLPVLFSDRTFPTPTGRVNLIHRLEAEPPQPTPKRPLLLMALSTDKAQGSQILDAVGLASVVVHPKSARGLKDGDRAWLESDVGAIPVLVRLDAHQRRDVALMTKGGSWREGRCANALIRAQETDAGGGAAYYDTPVRLTRN